MMSVKPKNSEKRGNPEGTRYQKRHWNSVLRHTQFLLDAGLWEFIILHLLVSWGKTGGLLFKQPKTQSQQVTVYHGSARVRLFYIALIRRKQKRILKDGYYWLTVGTSG